jgi:hypothetical protein
MVNVSFHSILAHNKGNCGLHHIQGASTFQLVLSLHMEFEEGAVYDGLSFQI